MIVLDCVCRCFTCNEKVSLKSNKKLHEAVQFVKKKQGTLRPGGNVKSFFLRALFELIMTSFLAASAILALDSLWMEFTVFLQCVKTVAQNAQNSYTYIKYRHLQLSQRLFQCTVQYCFAVQLI